MEGWRDGDAGQMHLFLSVMLQVWLFLKMRGWGGSHQDECFLFGLLVWFEARMWLDLRLRYRELQGNDLQGRSAEAPVSG